MAGEVDFYVELVDPRAETPDRDSDVVAVGGRHRVARRRRLGEPLRGGPPGQIHTKVLLAVVVLGLSVAVAFSAARPDAPTLDSAVTNSTPVAPTPSVAEPDRSLAALANLIAAVDSPTPLRDFAVSTDVRSPCPTGAAPGANDLVSGTASDPVAVIVAAVSRYLPQYRQQDASRGADPVGVCSVRIREQAALGSTLLITVSAPPNPPATPFVVLQGDDQRTAADVLAIVDGWRIEVGVTGLTSAMPSLGDLENLAVDSRMTW